jgi:hypothetical protein
MMASLKIQDWSAPAFICARGGRKDCWMFFVEQIEEHQEYAAKFEGRLL